MKAPDLIKHLIKNGASVRMCVDVDIGTCDKAGEILGNVSLKQNVPSNREIITVLTVFVSS